MHQPGMPRARTLAARSSIRTQRRFGILSFLRECAASRTAADRTAPAHETARARRPPSVAAPTALELSANCRAIDLNPAERRSPLAFARFAARSQFDRIPGVISPRQVLPHCLAAAGLALLVFAPAAGARKSGRQSRPATTREATAVPPLTFADNAGGLKQLATDILKAQEKGDPARAQQLLDSLVLPDIRAWYSENFTDAAVRRAAPAYEASRARLPAQLAEVFLAAHQEGFLGVDAVRYDDEESACSSPPVFSAMIFRRTRVPLYELHFTHGNQFKRLFAFAYVDGAFRLLVLPDFSAPVGPGSGKSVGPVHQGGAVASARLVCKVNPYYPQEARRRHVSGTVRLHTVIGKDGGVKQLELLSGHDLLAAAAKAAVSQWRYRPTLLEGEPVEVDTIIDVIFSLSP